MQFHQPTDIDEAVSLLSKNKGATCLAGGATLVAMMNARLAEPETLVSLKGIAELSAIERLADGSVRIGAMCRHRDTAQCTILTDGQLLVSAAAACIANPVVRNMGTIGGSIAFADPAADYPPALVAVGAVIEIMGPEGIREVNAHEFCVDWYTTILTPGELIVAVRVPAMPIGSVGVYHKLARVSGDFGIASVAVVLSMHGEICQYIRIAIGGCGPTPVSLPEVESALAGQSIEGDSLHTAGKHLANACDPVDDVRASAEYRRVVVQRMVVRAVNEARSRCGNTE